MLPGLGSVSGGKGGISGQTSQSTGDTMTRSEQGGGVDLALGGSDAGGGAVAGGTPWGVVAVAGVAVAALAVVASQ
jgi:hypothetical protein